MKLSKSIQRRLAIQTEHREDAMAVISKAEWVYTLAQRGWPDKFNFDWGVCSWGSCQYSGALAVYNLYNEIRKDLNKQDTLEVLGVTFKFTKILSFEEAKKNWLEELNEIYSDDLEFWQEMLNEAAKASSFDEMFEASKNMSSDLWNTAPTIAENVFQDMQLIDVPAAIGIGAVMNVLAQSENNTTGLLCALLKDYGMIQHETSFANFDT